jgi:hypothetical protein
MASKAVVWVSITPLRATGSAHRVLRTLGQALGFEYLLWCLPCRHLDQSVVTAR